MSKSASIVTVTAAAIIGAVCACLGAIHLLWASPFALACLIGLALSYQVASSHYAAIRSGSKSPSWEISALKLCLASAYPAYWALRLLAP